MLVQHCPFCRGNGILDLEEKHHFQCIDCMTRFAIVNVSDTVPYYEDTEAGLFPTTAPKVSSLTATRMIDVMEGCR
jgi:hypothetical protein